ELEHLDGLFDLADDRGRGIRGGLLRAADDLNDDDGGKDPDDRDHDHHLDEGKPFESPLTRLPQGRPTDVLFHRSSGTPYSNALEPTGVGARDKLCRTPPLPRPPAGHRRSSPGRRSSPTAGIRGPGPTRPWPAPEGSPPRATFSHPPTPAG